ncbi:UvrD-helicase domain-containing protein [Stenotrophomonas maltophilia]|uniref:UvrD-helicase domain-containing protein n=1 Tax=Stenotrophomonas maltophilia TaxID=40324 RepID=UPI000C1479E6|nr:UvrD-helicase domain-containing protein [Stenotrophomonas maltophilia]
MAFAPTEEQVAICTASGRVVKANAGAGTGKSSTLKHLARSFPQQRMLYLAFNKAIKLEAEASFPANVKAMTGHGLAFGHVGRKYAAVAGKLAQGDLKPFHVMPVLGRGYALGRLPADVKNLYAARVIETVKAFLASADHELQQRHVSLGGSPAEREHIDPKQLLLDAIRVWDDMQALEGSTPMLHDGYFKLYQISNPRLNYDVVLVDEAQDLNPALQAIIGSQHDRRVFLIGDTHQAIYSFRGASNAMELMRADQAFSLTGSFRFGPEVAEVANSILSTKLETMQLRGLGAPTMIGAIDAARDGHAMISRGNAALIAAAVEALHTERPFSFVGPLGNYRLDLYQDAHHLWAGDKNRIRDPFIKSFESFEELRKYGEALDDREVKGRVALVDKYRQRVPDLIQDIMKSNTEWTDGAQARLPENALVLSTAHKSKGLEFNRVLIADDFAELLDDEGQVKDFSSASEASVEEVNLQYVAVTRAQQVLHLSTGLASFLEAKQEADECTSRPTISA